MPSPRAIKTQTTFRMDCAVSATIQAPPARIWALLTDAGGFPRWNTTVTSMEGEIREGRTLRLKVPAAGERVFRPKVARVVEGREMVWTDGMAPMFRGVRTFTLTPSADGATGFSMREELSGLMLPLIRSSLPDFGPIFETYAADLKRAAEG